VDAYGIHVYNPYLDTSLVGVGAPALADQRFEQAVEHWRNGETAEAAYKLGLALHLVQDLCIPHHARLERYNGHAEFEGWLDEHRAEFTVPRGGFYDYQSAGEAVKENAEFSYPYYDQVKGEVPEQNYREVADEVVPQAIRSTAGMLNLFYKTVTSEETSGPMFLGLGAMSLISIAVIAGILIFLGIFMLKRPQMLLVLRNPAMLLATIIIIALIVILASGGLG
jgi:hypothetical protein